MDEPKPPRKRRNPKPAAAAAAASTTDFKPPADIRRVLPTQDWIANVDPKLLDNIAQAQVLSVTHFYNGLVRLRDDFSKQLFLPPTANQFPSQLTGTLLLPSGGGASGIAVTLLSFTDANNAPVPGSQSAITDSIAQFTLKDLPSAKINDSTPVTLQFRGANGTESRVFTGAQIGTLGILGNVTLKLALTPLPKSIVASLEDIVSSLDTDLPPEPRPGTPDTPLTLKMGDECPITFSRDLPDERHRYSILVRLVEPRCSIVTEILIFQGAANNGLVLSPFRNKLWGAIQGTVHSFADRVPVDQPISVDGFRDRIVGNEGGTIFDEETIPMAGTLGLGYTVDLAQNWRQVGLSLGDLVYSLPLAPGEQQRVAVFEQRQTLSVAELETLDFDEQQRASQQSDSSTDAVFNSSFAESVRGSSSFTTNAESSSWGVAGGIGGFIAPIAFGIGAGGGGGSSSSSGSSNNSLDGTRNYVSTAASHAHSSIEREASGRRHAQRTGMRLATASDIETVTTKVITNNNRAHALTMQYWEVLRHFEITTAVDGVTLVCFVPLEVVRFLPPGVSYNLNEAEIATRQQILYRYGQIIKHADVLRKWIPFGYRQGLQILDEFASNPRAVPSFGAPTEDIINIQVTGSFLPMEDIYVTVLTRRGTRLGPVQMNGPIPKLPDLLTDPTHTFQTKAALIAELLRRRAPDQNIPITANITLPSSTNPDEIVGFELSRRFRAFTYQLNPPTTDPFQQLIASGNFGTTLPFLQIYADRIDAQVNGVNMQPSQLEQELGGPSIWGFSAGITGPPLETYASGFISQAERLELPAAGYPIAAQSVSPLLKFNQLLQIEKALQHVVRNTVTYSRAVWMSVTPEERAIMLEGFTIGVPSGGIPDVTQNVPLLNCVANRVLGFYGNAMIMPFNIPAEIATQLSVTGGQDGPTRPFTTGEIQAALTHFHRAGFDPPVSHVALPTNGVLGEAVLGSCPSAEKIDLTRFWNWQDSPLPQAADIAGTTLNKGSTLVGATAPSTLTGLPSLVNNINAPPADANAVLQGLITAAQQAKDLPDITGIQQLAQIQEKTLQTAESARADALAKAQSLATKGLDAAGSMIKAKADSDKAATDAAQKKDADAQKARTQQLQTGAQSMRQNSKNFLGVANSQTDQDSANAYAQQILGQIFGSGGVPIDVASSMFTQFQEFQPGTKNLTQGSTAFLSALGLI